MTSIRQAGRRLTSGHCNDGDVPDEQAGSEAAPAILSAFDLRQAGLGVFHFHRSSPEHVHVDDW
jgi:hypothetical protein